MSSAPRQFRMTDYGPVGLLVRFADRADEGAFHRGARVREALAGAGLSGLVELVPAFTTILLVFSSEEARRLARPQVDRSLSGLGLAGGQAFPGGAGPRRVVEIPVRYDGPDLPRVAGLAKLAEDEVVERHLAARYRVHCLGFAPGFPYLGGLPPSLHTPRLASPRPRIPAGSVAIGGEHTGIYPVPSPGGWNLIGWTPLRLFRPEAQEAAGMFLLQPGDEVRFQHWSGEDHAEAGSPAPAEPGAGADEKVKGSPCLRLLSAGVGVSLQDRGRPGYARFGVASGGCMDPSAAGWANRLLDNDPQAPVLELCLSGQEFEVLQHGWVAVAGAGEVRRETGHRWAAFPVRRGDRLKVGPGPAGVWTYLAVPGGWVGRTVLGSCSVHARAGLGRLARPGDVLRRTSAAGFRPPPSTAGRRVFWTEIPDYATPALLRVWPGPQGDLFAPGARERFFTGEWTVSSRSDRVGYRLEGAGLAVPDAEMISEPVLPGSIQIPPDGHPIITMPDGPTLGGYPKLGVLEPADLAVLAQCRPGQRLRFLAVAG